MTLEIYNAANGIPFGKATIGGEGGKNYDKEIQELQDKIKEIELFKFPNATIVGEPSIDHGQIANFSTENYLMFPFELDVRDKAFDVYFPFTTSDDVTTQQNILDSRFGIALAIKDGLGLMAVSYNGQSWGSLVSGVMPIQPNTTYYAKLSWNKLQYITMLSKNGTDYTEDMSFVSATGPFPATIFIGGGSTEALGHTPTPFKGTINLNKAYVYINGQLIWQGMDDAGLATRLDVDLTNIAQPGIEAIQNIVGNPYTKTEIDEQMEDKQDKLIAGPNITINPETNEISATGGGEPIDAYTKEETDGLLEKKQDVLTPNDPLKIETYVKSNLTNMVYTTDGTGIYRGSESPISAGLGAKYYFGMDSSSGIVVSIDPNKALVNYTPEEIMFANGYVQMPYTFGQIVRGGNPATSSYNSSIMVFGKLVGNDFIPILARNYGSERSTPELELFTSDNITIEDTGSRPSSTGRNYRLKQTGTSLPSGGYTTALYGVPTTVKITDNAGIINISYIHNDYYTSQNISDTAYVKRLREIDTVRLFPIYNRGSSEATAIQVSKIGLYTTNASLTKDTPVVPPAEWGPNQFDLSGVTAYNYLDLKTDNSLTVTPEGNLSVNTDAMAFGSELDYDGTNLSLLSSDGGTLSAVEINLEDKQDKLTPNDPLKIETYVKSNMVGMKYTDDLTGVLRNPANTGVCTSLHSLSTDTSILFTVATSASATGYTLEDVYKSTGYIDIPYTFGQVLNVGSVLANVSYRIPNCTLGKFVDGKYIPILSFRHSQNSYDYIYFKINPADELVTEVQSTNTTYIKTSSAQADLSYGTGACTGKLGALIQLTQSSTGKVSVRMVYGTHRHTLPDTEIPAAYQSRLQEITTCRIAPTSQQGDTTPLAVAQIGLYNATSNITGNETSYEEWGPNQFDIYEVTTTTELDLKVDNTTIKVNSDGNLEALYPAELNGVKLFPITQAAYDDLAEKDPSTLYVITDGAETMLADASNITTAGKTALSGLGMPSSSYTSLSLGASGSRYIAPANGWFVVAKQASAVGQEMSLAVVSGSTGIGMKGSANRSDASVVLFVPVLKSQEIEVTYQFGGATWYFRFIPAEGSK